MHRHAVTALMLLTAAMASGCGLINQKPIARIGFAGETLPYGPAPLTVQFDLSGTRDRDGSLVSLQFEFGDGSTPWTGVAVPEEPIVHTYEPPGSYTAILTVTDDRGATASYGVVVVVEEPEAEEEPESS